MQKQLAHVFTTLFKEAYSMIRAVEQENGRLCRMDLQYEQTQIYSTVLLSLRAPAIIVQHSAGLDQQ